MPKTFSEHERAVIKESMLDVGASLMREKGIRRVSVEDIAKRVNIATGSFYSFYSSKEELLWDIIKREERQMVEQFLLIASLDLDTKTKLRKMYYDVYLREGSIVYFLSQEDVDYIVRKISPEILKSNRDDAYNLHRTILTACNLEVNQENIDIALILQNMLVTAINSDLPRSEPTRKKVLSIIVEALVEYLSGGNNDN